MTAKRKVGRPAVNLGGSEQVNLKLPKGSLREMRALAKLYGISPAEMKRRIWKHGLEAERAKLEKLAGPDPGEPT